MVRNFSYLAFAILNVSALLPTSGHAAGGLVGSGPSGGSSAGFGCTTQIAGAVEAALTEAAMICKAEKESLTTSCNNAIADQVTAVTVCETAKAATEASCVTAKGNNEIELAKLTAKIAKAKKLLKSAKGKFSAKRAKLALKALKK